MSDQISHIDYYSFSAYCYCIVSKSSDPFTYLYQHVVLQCHLVHHYIAKYKRFDIEYAGSLHYCLLSRKINVILFGISQFEKKQIRKVSTLDLMSHVSFAQEDITIIREKQKYVFSFLINIVLSEYSKIFVKIMNMTLIYKITDKKHRIPSSVLLT
jgi:hypothetical protein